MSEKGRRKLSQEEFNEIYEKHQLWLNNEEGGVQADFTGLDLTEIDFEGRKNLYKAIFVNADLSDVDLRKAYIEEGNFRDAELIGTNLEDAHLYRCDFQNANLTDANLKKANLRRAEMIDAILKNANLDYASMVRVNLNYADLTGAICVDANMRAASCTYTKFINTNLQNVKFPGATTSTADFSGANVSNVIWGKASMPAGLSEKASKQIEDRFNMLSEKNIDKKTLKRIDEEIRETLEKKSFKDRTLVEVVFDEFHKINQPIREEINRLNILYNLYLIAVILFALILGLVWARYYVSNPPYTGLKESLYKSWRSLAPSTILVGFIWGCISLVHKTQKQIEDLKKYIHHIKQVKAIMGGHVAALSIEDPSLKKRMDEILDRFFEQIIRDKASDNIPDLNNKSEIDMAKGTLDAILKQLGIRKIIDGIN